MDANQNPGRKPAILMDLKPAFDGFAGIPQETRLLFRGLRQAGAWDVKGLIQHGSRRMTPGLSSDDANLSASSRIFQLSRVIVSLSEATRQGGRERASYYFNRHFALEMLRLRSALDSIIPTSTFDSRLFPDFIWRTLFDKTLDPGAKDEVSMDDFRLLAAPRQHFHKAGMQPLPFVATPCYPRIDTRGFDFFVAQTPFPGRLTPGTRMVVRYHDAIPLLMPHTISDKAFHQASHYQALRSNIESGAVFTCVSQATRKDLLTLYPQIEEQTAVIHDMVSEDYFEDSSPAAMVSRVVRNRLADVDLLNSEKDLDNPVPDEFEYLLVVSTLEPRKNHQMLLNAWERLKYGTHPHLKLVVVGSLGWDYAPLLKAFKRWAERGELYYLQNVPSAELRALYRHARATVCPSFAEGFDYAGVEAMRCGCPVAASDIAVHREVYDDACEYFNPYSVDSAAHVLANLLADDGKLRRAELIAKGRTVSARYLPASILPAWLNFLHSLK